MNNRIPATIAQAAKNAGVRRFIHVSALEGRPDAASQFGKTKWAGEQAVKEIFPQATILRPATLFGYEDRLLNK